MTIKLIDMNIGIQLTLLVDGKEQKVSWSAVCPSESHEQFTSTLNGLLGFLNQNFDTEFDWMNTGLIDVEIAKPKRIKAPKRVSHAEFNKKIKELQP